MHELTHRGMRRTLAQGEGDGTPPQEGTGELFRQRVELRQSPICRPVTALWGEDVRFLLPGLRRGEGLWDWKLREQPEAESRWPFCLPGIVIRSLVRGARGQGQNPITWRAG